MAQFTNQALLSYNNAVVSSNIAVGQILEVLSLTKTALRRSYTAGDHLVYVINIINSGTSAFSGLTLTDDLGAATGSTAPLTYVPDSIQYQINGVVQATPTVSSADPLTVTGITVPAGGNTTVIYETTANVFAAPGTNGTVTNTATLSGTGVTALTADETVTAAASPMLSITKSVSPVPVTENGQLTYTFLIQNTGNTAAEDADAVSVSDTFNPRLNNLTATLNGTALTSGTDYTYNAITGTFATVPGRITVPAATYTQNTDGSWGVTPGSAVLTVTGTV